VNRIVEHLLISRDQPCGSGERFPAAGIASEARVRTTGNLQADAVAFQEAVGSRPQLELHFLNTSVNRGETPGHQPDNPVAEVDRFAGRKDITQSGKEVGMLKARSRVHLDPQRADHFQVLLERQATALEILQSVSS
jgi:hypothetical protein